MDIIIASIQNLSFSFLITQEHPHTHTHTRTHIQLHPGSCTCHTLNNLFRCQLQPNKVDQFLVSFSFGNDLCLFCPLLFMNKKIGTIYNYTDWHCIVVVASYMYKFSLILILTAFQIKSFNETCDVTIL